MDIAYVAYLLFVIPGFCVVWTYRHFVKSSRIGEFEYAAWSLLWGTVVFLFFGLLLKINFLPIGTNDSEIDLQNPFSLIGSLIGSSLATATTLAFPIGYFGAYLSNKQYFKIVDERLFKFIEK